MVIGNRHLVISSLALLRVADGQGPVGVPRQEPTILTYGGYADNANVALSCPGNEIFIAFAYIRSTTSANCGAVVTSAVRKQCAQQASCSFAQTTGFFGFDACADSAKMLELYYTCMVVRSNGYYA